MSAAAAAAAAPPPAQPGWAARLQIAYRQRDGRCTALDRHEGPLRVLQPLHPEGPGVLHHVLVHPPGGIVGGDTLALQATLHEGSHALLTTPGATRFYRSDGRRAEQRATLRVAAGARLEWLPLEAIAHPGCEARNTVELQLALGAEAMAWDVLALGLPAAGQAFDAGVYTQRLSLQVDGDAAPRWLEAARIAATDLRLLDSPLGLAGRRAVGTLAFACGGTLAADRRDALLDAARALCDGQGANLDLDGGLLAGATSPAEGVVVLRALAPRTEPLLRLFAAVRGAWRGIAWSMPATLPRVWRT